MLKEIPKSTKQISFNANVLLKISKHHSKGSLYRENEAFFILLIISMEHCLFMQCILDYSNLLDLSSNVVIRKSNQNIKLLFSTIKLSSFTGKAGFNFFFIYYKKEQSIWANFEIRVNFLRGWYFIGNKRDIVNYIFHAVQMIEIRIIEKSR